jgi:hypothetical protein
VTPAAESALAHVRARAGTTAAPPAGVLQQARITVSFHPDRPVGGGTVAQALARDGVYRSQFETGISNGGLTAHPGGDRHRWEHTMFGGAYPGDRTAGRPVYGGLNLAGHPDGASPRFGSCYLRLTAAATARATFSHGDSATEPTVAGTADAFGGIWAALLDEVARTGKALGVGAATPDEWVAALSAPRTAAGRALDDYVEAQVHGGVALSADVEAVVADPSFSGTPTGDVLAALGPPLQWHPGFVLAPADFPADLRGPDTPRLAAHLAGLYDTELIDAALIGRAAAEPHRWAGYPQQLQQLKWLWHILVRRGRPVAG